MAKQEAFRILPYSFFSLQDSFISVPRPYSELPGKAQKSSDLSIGASCWRYLSSRAVTRKVLSAQMSLTSVFGMGTGVPSPQSTPTIYLSSGLPENIHHYTTARLPCQALFLVTPAGFEPTLTA